MTDKRLKILSKSETNELYNIPQFTIHEQQAYFSLSKKEYKAMSKCKNTALKVHFILQLGYFKATSQFFNCAFYETKRDVEFILQEYFNNTTIYVKKISDKKRQENQREIAKLLGYQTDKSIIKQKLEKMLETKTKLCNNPVYLFHEALCYSNENKLMLLGYTTLQDLIGAAITNEESRLGVLLKKHLSADTWDDLEKMLNKDADNNQYVLTALKKGPKGFKYKQIIGEIKKLKNHTLLYQSTKTILPKLKLSNQNIKYYAELAVHYPISKLQELSSTIRAIYILCYVHHRHQKIIDNLMVAHHHYAKKYKSDAELKARDYIFKEKLDINEDSKNAATVLRFFDDEKISNKATFGSVRKRAYKHVEKGKFKLVSDYLQGLLFDFHKTKWDETLKLKHKITKNLRPIFKSLEFTGNDSQKPLLSAISFLKNYFDASTKDRKQLLEKAPIACIKPENRKYVLAKDENAKNSEQQVDIAKYEFMIYHLITEKIESGLIYLEDSVSFKSLSSHLVDDKRWENKSALLKKLGNKKLLTPISKLLNQAEKELENLIKLVNKRIKNGENTGIKIKKDGDEITFTLPYPDTADKENHPIFKQMTQVSIAEVLRFAQKDCDFMSAFTHIKPYDAKDTLDPIAMMACIIANATNLGIHKMAESSDLSYNRMRTQMKNFIRLETLHDANDLISNAIANLPIFKHWNIRDDVIHGSVDGQKFETRLHSFIARYSSKYFGVNCGVVAYTLCANHVPVNTKIISANQHESHFLFDILFNNSSEIDIEWLSGDSHAINQINFSLLDFIDKQFAPHFKAIKRKSENLHGFKQLHTYERLLIQPKNKIDKKLIKTEWDNIQRIIASLLLGETSQHLIVSKLSSYKRKNQTKKALWQYDKILMSIYMLNFINDAMIRMNVRRALNRGESYHKLRRAIANVHGRKFRGSNDREIELWNECARLMANCMIYYNAKLLNALLQKFKKEGNEKLIEQLKYISPVAWIDINLYGYYMFEENQEQIDMTEIAEKINMLKTV